MARPKSPPPKVRSETFHVRLREDEEAGLKQLAADLHQPASRVVRRLIREALTTGPDYFDDGLLELRQMRRALDRVGGNLNQLVRAAHQGTALDAAAVRRAINAVAVQVEAVSALYRRAEMAGVGRAILPPAPAAPAPEEGSG